MARKALKVKQQRKQKFSTREYTRCERCGRPHAVIANDAKIAAIPNNFLFILFLSF